MKPTPGKQGFVVTSGLTRRLIEADDARHARVLFLRDVPRANVLKVPHEAVFVHEATPENLLEFRKGKKAVFDDQLAMDLGDDRRGMVAGPKRGKRA